MKMTPTNVKNIVIMFKIPHDSFRNSFAKIVTKTGVEKIITDASERGMWRKAKKANIRPIVPTKQRSNNIILLPSGNAFDPLWIKIGMVGSRTPRNLKYVDG